MNWYVTMCCANREKDQEESFENHIGAVVDAVGTKLSYPLTKSYDKRVTSARWNVI